MWCGLLAPTVMGSMPKPSEALLYRLMLRVVNRFPLATIAASGAHSKLNNLGLCKSNPCSRGVSWPQLPKMVLVLSFLGGSCTQKCLIALKAKKKSKQHKPTKESQCPVQRLDCPPLVLFLPHSSTQGSPQEASGAAAGGALDQVWGWVWSEAKPGSATDESTGIPEVYVLHSEMKARILALPTWSGPECKWLSRE